jgi:hypothetical protein
MKILSKRKKWRRVCKPHSSDALDRALVEDGGVKCGFDKV